MDETERVYFTQTEKEVSIFFFGRGCDKIFLSDNNLRSA